MGKFFAKILNVVGYILDNMLFWPYTLWVDDRYRDPFPYIGMTADMFAATLFFAGVPLWLVLAVVAVRVVAPTTFALWIVYIMMVPPRSARK